MSDTLKHIGYIADGNRRWARRHNLPTLEGHRRGADRVELIIDALKDTEAEYVSFYLFSTENWNRSPKEVSYLMDLTDKIIQKLAKKMQKENLRCVIMGRPEPVKPQLWQKMLDIETSTKDNTGLTVCICFNYGGQWEIADAATKAVQAGETNITPETLAKYLYHPEIPPLDLVVRTSGEKRLSGFQLWRAAYSEFLFVDKFFPEIEASDVMGHINEFHQRQRRFGQ